VKGAYLAAHQLEKQRYEEGLQAKRPPFNLLVHSDAWILITKSTDVISLTKAAQWRSDTKSQNEFPKRAPVVELNAFNINTMADSCHGGND